MIVRCNNCVSAFAVDDEKVANKKFAFTCPKCSSENIIDNRINSEIPEEKKLPAEESFFNDDFSIDTDSPEKEYNLESDSRDDLFSDSSSTDDKNLKDDKFSAIEDEFASEFPEEDLLAESGKKDRNLNLEIEESADLPEIDEEDIFSEKPSPAKQKSDDDLFSEISAIDDEEEFISFDEEQPVKKTSDEFDIELKDDSVKTEEEDIFFDDFDEKPETAPVKKDSVKDTAPEEETSFEFEDIDTETITEDTKNEREKKLSSQDDIDALFAEEGIAFDEKPISKQSEIDFEDEITVDLDLLDIELEETAEDKDKKLEPAAVKSINSQPSSVDDITLDINDLDIDLEETAPGSDIFDEPVNSEIQKNKTPQFDEEITLDIDNLDIDLDETSPGSEIFDEPETEKQKNETPQFDEEITLDIDNLDIDLDETSTGSEIFDEPVKAEKLKNKTDFSVEDIELEIDDLDIDLTETSLDSDLFEEPVSVKNTKNLSKKTISTEDLNDFNEEDIKLNLDDLDIDIAEIEERDLIFEDDIIEKPVQASRQKSRPVPEDDDEDESITIDLETLELEIADENNAMTGELSEEDEKLTLDDAGLTFEELTSEMEKTGFEDLIDEDVKLSLDDIDPELTLEKISQSGRLETERLSDSLDELPEIDLDEYDAIVRHEENRASAKTADEFEDEFVIFPETENIQIDERKSDYDIFDYDESDVEKSSPEKGSTFFSIDFSLKYSRIGALLRLLGLYSLSMIPHFIVMLIYTILSSIVGFINQIVILSTGRCVEDFAIVIENTMRYFFYIKTNITGIVEDRPVYAGKEYLDHPLQLNITYPVKYSKNLAILRLSIAGILLITLPHLIIMSLITVTIPFVYLTGIIAVIITRRWPNVLFNYLTKYFRYLARISSFMIGLTDEYPPFSFD